MWSESRRPRRSARSRRLRVVGACLAAVALVGGCGTGLHPGAAAVVDGTAITDEQMEDLSVAACNFTEVSSDDENPSLVIADLRTSLLGSLISFQLTESAAAEMGITVSDADVARMASQQPPVPDGLAADDQEVIEQFFEDVARNQIQQALIGARVRDRSITDVDQATEEDVRAAQEFLNEYFADVDVDVSPSYGRWDGNSLVQSTGSLSDPVFVTPAEPPEPGQPNEALKTLPSAQLCG